MENKQFTIYSISTNGDVFYIGRTCDLRRRKTEHLRESHKKYNTYKVNKIRKLQSLGEPIEFNILHENLNYDDSVQMEIQEIKQHKEDGHILTNLTEGGEGTNGSIRIFTDEWKENLKKAKEKQYYDGYVVHNKGKKLAEIVGSEQKAKEVIEKILKTRKENHAKGLHKVPATRPFFEPINKGKKIEEIVGEERAIELKKISSDNAKRNFVGIKQNKEHILKRSKSQSETKSNWTDEKRNEFSEKYRLNRMKSVKKQKFIINNKYEFYGTWKSLSEDILETLGIKVLPQSLSEFYRGKFKTLKCGIFDIKIIF